MKEWKHVMFVTHTVSTAEVFDRNRFRMDKKRSKIIIKKLRSRGFCNFLKTHKFHAVSKIIFRQVLNKLARLMLLKF